MSAYLRPRIPGATVFFTVALADRSSRLLIDEVALLREAVGSVQRAHPFRIDAWVVLPDHLHAVWTLPPGDAGYSARWAAIKARFTMGVRESGAILPVSLPVVRTGRYAGLKPGLRLRKREVGIWQRRFWEHHIRDEADLQAHVRYCWWNPVKHDLAERPSDWPLSSIHRDIRAGKVDAGWAAATPDGSFGE